MTATWHELVANLAVVALFAAIWFQLTDWLDDQPRALRKLAVGGLAGLGAIGTMFMAVEVAPGVFFDLRAGIISVAAFFAGPVSGIIAAAIAITYRVLEGGSGVYAGVFYISAAVLIGWAMRVGARSPTPSSIWLVNLALATSVVVLATALLLRTSVDDAVIREFMPPTTLLSFVATLIMGLAIRKGRMVVRERRILAAALAQTPEFIYVKDASSRFIAANHAVARHNGFTDPRQMIGLTDRDITDKEHADRLLAQEQQIIETGQPTLDVEEEEVDDYGEKRCFRSSKVPVRDRDGHVMGLAGVTVETTHLKRLETELIESRDRLSLALSEMSDGLAVFDSMGYLVFCNEQYRSNFPLSAHVRVPGVHVNEILRECARTGEQVDVPQDDVEGWAERVGSLLRIPNVVTVELFDGRFVQIRNRPAPNDSSIVMVTDVTDLKLAEKALIEANADLSRQASTDALTGLANRRVFDETLARDMARCGRAGTPLSLILLDVDHFKRYNDTYGHQAGDECLVMVADAIKGGLHRPADLAARYGGEEFAVILPETDSEGAAAVAERIRQAITAASIVRIGSIGTRITASLGVAEYNLDTALATPADLIRDADAALYAAKTNGRDRVVVDKVDNPRHRLVVNNKPGG